MKSAGFKMSFIAGFLEIAHARKMAAMEKDETVDPVPAESEEITPLENLGSINESEENQS